MTPLVVRPQPQADALAQRLRTAGHHPIVCPLLALTPGDELPALPEQLSHADLVVVVSRHAVLFAHDFLLHTGLTWPAIEYFAVGEASAMALHDVGLQGAWPEDPRSEGLLALPALQQVATNITVSDHSQQTLVVGNHKGDLQGARLDAFDCIKNALAFANAEGLHKQAHSEVSGRNSWV